ncbi:MAG: hypothetical protein ACXWEA_04835, partial [Solirubrobacterales bacterium]
MLAGYLTGALICASALAAGQAAMALCGARRPSLLAPAVGLSLLLIVANLAEKLPGGATSAGIGVVALTVVSVGLRLAGWGAGDGPAAPTRVRGAGAGGRAGGQGASW